MRISKFFDKAIADGRLMSGIWQKRTCLGAKLVNEILRRFIELMTSQPCVVSNWDFVIVRCLDISLHSALVCRIDELASNFYYPTQYLRFEDIQIFQEIEAMASIHLKITLKWCKGQRNDSNVDQVHFSSAETDE